MGDVYGGNLIRVAIWHETTWGSETPTTAYEIPIAVDNLVIGETQELIESQEARASRKEAEPFTGLLKSEGNQLNVIAKYLSLPHVLKQVISATITKTGASAPYNHAAILGALPVGFGVEVAIVDPDVAANSIIQRAYGCRTTELMWPLAKPAGEMILGWKFNAKKVTDPATGTPITASTFTEDPILFADMDVFTVNASNALDVLDMSLTLTLDAQQYYTARNEGRAGLTGSYLTRIRGQLQSLVHSSSVYDGLAAARTSVAVVAGFSSGDDGLTVTLADVIFDKGPLSVQGPQGIPLNRAFGAYDDETTDAPIKVAVDNTQATDY